ncbi:MAG: amino acid ABC transporter substrate-binding protein [Planctomycetes bacterium]|nr:amino acid ABC transporter substrate-binding protein [Planctomycetota bacterium]
MTIKQFITDCITGIDGESADIGRVLWVLGALAFLGLSVYAVLKSGTFDGMGFGAGYGGVLGGGGAAIGMKAKTEPGPEQ